MYSCVDSRVRVLTMFFFGTELSKGIINNCGRNFLLCKSYSRQQLGIVEGI